MKLLGIFGTSGLAREVNDVATDLGFQTVYIARDQTEYDAWSSRGDIVLERDIANYTHMKFSIGIGENTLRQAVATRYSGELEFVNLIHPSATFGGGQFEALSASQGVVILAGARFTNNIKIGNFTLINPNATIAHDVVIEAFVNIAPGANISGNVHIGERCLIGTGAVINQGTPSTKLKIGPDTVIGSGAVVISDCDANAVYAGVPARRLR